MALVFLAEHKILKRKVAIKVIRRDLLQQEQLAQRFYTEAQAAAQIQHEHVVGVLDCGTTTDNAPYIVLEYLEGRTLEALLQAEGPLPVPRAVAIIMQVLSGLSAAHEHGIVHRDLKPENIYLLKRSGPDYVKLLDFGLAKLTGGTPAYRTRTGALLGTPHYMSPEQCEGRGEIDPRSDLYSIGCILFRLLTGRPPFIADSFGEMLVKHLNETPPSARLQNPQVPFALDQIIRRCLSKRREDRYASAAELLVVLRERAFAADPDQPTLLSLTEEQIRKLVTLADEPTQVNKPVPIAHGLTAPYPGGAPVAQVAPQPSPPPPLLAQAVNPPPLVAPGPRPSGKTGPIRTVTTPSTRLSTLAEKGPLHATPLAAVEGAPRGVTPPRPVEAPMIEKAAPDPALATVVLEAARQAPSAASTPPSAASTPPSAASLRPQVEALAASAESPVTPAPAPLSEENLPLVDAQLTSSDPGILPLPGVRVPTEAELPLPEQQTVVLPTPRPRDSGPPGEPRRPPPPLRIPSKPPRPPVPVAVLSATPTEGGAAPQGPAPVAAVQPTSPSGRGAQGIWLGILAIAGAFGWLLHTRNTETPTDKPAPVAVADLSVAPRPDLAVPSDLARGTAGPDLSRPSDAGARVDLVAPVARPDLHAPVAVQVPGTQPVAPPPVAPPVAQLPGAQPPAPKLPVTPPTTQPPVAQPTAQPPLAQPTTQPPVAQPPAAGAGTQAPPATLQGQLAAARQLLDTHRPQEACVAFQRILETYPADPEVHVGLGACHVAQGHFGEAAEHYAEALQHRPGHPPAYFGLGWVYEKRGETAAALDWYHRYLEVSPQGEYAGLARQRIERLERLLGTGADPAAGAR